jgi:hypothetical protein
VRAQSFRASLVGTVRDESGAILPGVSITITNLGTSLQRTAITNERGDYLVSELPVGRYSVAAELTGFRKEVRTGITLQIDQRARIDLNLKVGAVSEVLEVTANAPLVQSESAAIGNVVDNRKITDLPLNGRQFLQLNLLVPGAVTGIKGSQLSTQGGAVSINGFREQQNQFILDGVDNTDLSINQYAVSPSIDSIQEFKVQSGTYSAAFGGRGGAQINVITKSGTNAFHGSAFEFIRNDNLDARNFFDQKRAEFKRNQYGGSIGGPIQKDRTFFFFSYEGTNERKGTTRTGTVPTVLEKAGDFSQSGITIYDPNTLDTATGRRQPFPNNQIPAGRLSSIGRAIAVLYPDPNLPGTSRNFISSPIRRRDVHQFTTRIDYKLSNSDDLSGRYSVDDDKRYDTFEPFTRRTNVPGFGTDTLNRGQLASISWIRLFSPRSLNEFRIGFNRFRNGIFSENRRLNYVQQLGITPYAPIPDISFGYPAFTIVGYDNLGEAANQPQNRRNNTYQLVDTWSYTFGEHSFKAGFAATKFQANTLFDSNTRGSMTFDRVYTASAATNPAGGNALADLLLGLPFRTSVQVGEPLRYRFNANVGAFFQDDWKLSDRLTLNLGMRYEVNSPITEKYNRVSWFDESLGRMVVPLQEPSAPKRPFDFDKNNFAPRVGFALRPFRDASTVVRGGYGVYFDMKLQNIVSGFVQNPPFRTSYDFFGNRDIANLTLANPFPRASGSEPAPSPSAVNRDYPDSYVQQWSFNIQRELTTSVVLDVGYVGTKGSKLSRFRDINQPTPANGPVASRRPLPAFGSITLREASGNSIYNAFQLRVEKRVTMGLTLQTSYTFSKSIDDSSSWGELPQDSRNLRGERGLSSYDSHNRLSVSSVYDLPWGSGRHFLSDLSGVAATLLSGWQVNGFYSVQTGRPLTVSIGSDRSNTGIGGRNRPDRIGNPILPRSQRTPDRWFDAGAFAIQPQFTYGNAGRNTLLGPGINNLDFSVLKNTRVREGKNLQFRMEIFNLANHPNFDNPNTQFDSSQFGTIFSAEGTERQIQFALKYIF